MLEGYSALSYLAAVTERVQLGTLVTGVTYRHPGVLVKTVTTLDVLSGGRAYLGIGAAWFDREHHGLGVPFPPLDGALRAPRGDAADRASRCGRGEARPFEGKHYQLAETLCVAAAARAAAPADPDRRHRREEDAAPRRAVRRRLQPLRVRRRATSCATSSTCCAATATTRARDYDAIEKTALGTVRARQAEPGGRRREVPRAGGARHPARHLQLPERARDRAAADLRQGSDPGGRRTLTNSATRRFTLRRYLTSKFFEATEAPSARISTL